MLKEKPWERKASMREWDVGKNEKNKEGGRPDKLIRDEKTLDKRRHRSPERSPEPGIYILLLEFNFFFKTYTIV